MLDFLVLLVIEVKLKAIQAGNGFSVVLFSDRIFICAHIYDIRRHDRAPGSSLCRYDSTHRKPGELSVKLHIGSGQHTLYLERSTIREACQLFGICLRNLIDSSVYYGSIFTVLNVRHLSRLFNDLVTGCFLHNRLCLIFDHDVIHTGGKSRYGQHCHDHDRCDNERKEFFSILL